MSERELTDAALRFREALDRRQQGREDLRDHARGAQSLREYIDITRAHQSGPLQQTAHLGYSHIKRR